MVYVVFPLLAFVTYIGLPAVLISGWVKWARGSHLRGLLPTLSLISFTFGTASALLAICTASYALVIRRFPYYDPLLLRIYAWGAILSLIAVVLSCIGAWRPCTVRWHSLVLSWGMLVLWFAWASGE
jgi:hypothetical protein